jgi:ABC-type uncharacterized transport system substrate-binding protein
MVARQNRTAGVGGRRIGAHKGGRDLLYLHEVTEKVRKATKTIPIVMPAIPDPLETGFAATLARPGANITGVSSMTRELEEKRLELLREVLPRAESCRIFDYEPLNIY